MAAEKINGITPKMVENAKTIDQIAPVLRRYINDGIEYIGYDSPFDL